MKKTKIEDLKRIEVDQFKKKKKREVIIILDNVRSLNNIGSCFRTSDAFIIKKIYLVGITGSPPNKDIDRTALGATESIDWEHVSSISKIEKELKEEGWKIALIEQTDESIKLQNFNPKSDEKFAFVFGNEVFGVSDEALQCAELAIEIPQFGTKHSFNITVSLGIVLWDHLTKTTGAHRG
ncbi:MAG: RNA methyltransferase [Flammeovirgaceae bacterium]|nr:RNA methyltransferase [Flammeovirgaceae bacterium]PDH45590.1 MAG: RNA methyltransferase [Rhodothermaeota bacterium MED-G18]